MASNPYMVPAPHDRQTILCLYCNQPMEVGTRAITATCKHCGKPLRFEDIRITKYEPKKRAVETYGNILVEKKGNCIAERIRCGGIVVRGKVDGAVTCRGAVRVGAQGEIRGDVTAPTLAVDAGAILEGFYRIGETVPAGATE